VRNFIAVVFAAVLIGSLLWLFPTAYGLQQTPTGAAICKALGGCSN
jgi:hypothetical protein